MADSGREDEGNFDRDRRHHSQRSSKPPIRNELRRNRRDPQSDSEDERPRREYLRRDPYDDKDSASYRQNKRNREENSPVKRESIGSRRENEDRYTRRNYDYDDEPFNGKRAGDRYYNSRKDVNEVNSFARHKDYVRPNDQDLPELYSIHKAKVQSIRPFGFFVRIEGFYKQGLVHLSHLSDHEVVDRETSDEQKIQAIAAIASEGDWVWVKVISLKDESGNVKIGCSLKLVSQSSGKDLDPTNVKLEQQQKNKRSQKHDPKKLILDAVYNVTCTRCGGHGHLKTECYASRDKTYELIPEEDEDDVMVAEAAQAQLKSNASSMMPGFGRGRSMVLPAWMTNKSGPSTRDPEVESAEKKKKKTHKKKTSELPENVTTVEDALALIAQLRKDKDDKKHRKKGHRKHSKD